MKRRCRSSGSWRRRCGAWGRRWSEWRPVGRRGGGRPLDKRWGSPTLVASGRCVAGRHTRRVSFVPSRKEDAAMTTIAKSTYVKKGEGQALWVLGQLFDIKAGAHETGSLAIVEMTFAPGKPGAPPHRHHCGEAVYVLEGTIRYH